MNTEHKGGRRKGQEARPPITGRDVVPLIRASKGQPGKRHRAGDNVYLNTENGSGLWTMSYWEKDGDGGGRARSTSLGRAGDKVGELSLKEAKDKRVIVLAQLLAGTYVLPAERRGILRRTTAPAMVVHVAGEPAGVLFKDAAEQYLKDHAGEWKASEHVRYKALIAKRCAPIADLDVSAITPQDVAEMLKAVPWTGPNNKPGSLVRSFCERILGAANIGNPQYANPATWKGKQEHLLEKTGKAPTHFASLPWQALPALCAEIATDSGDEQSLALRFIILTAVRKEEALGAYWHEIDTANKLWTIPAERMKGGKAHTVLLSQAALDLLGHPGDGDAHIFGGNGLNRYLDSFGRVSSAEDGSRPVTIHGFRSTFADWANEHPKWSQLDHVSEKNLSHADANKVRAAYKRSELLDLRRQQMDDYSKFAISAQQSTGQIPVGHPVGLSTVPSRSV